MGSKIVRFLREMDSPSRNLDNANFLPKRKESSVPLLVVQIHFMALMVCLRALTLSKSRSSVLLTCLLYGLPKTLLAEKLLEGNCF